MQISTDSLINLRDNKESTPFASNINYFSVKIKSPIIFPIVIFLSYR